MVSARVLTACACVYVCVRACAAIGTPLAYEAVFAKLTATVRTAAAGYTPLDKTWNRFNPMATIAYDVTDTTHVYAKYATGYRSGGASSRRLKPASTKRRVRVVATSAELPELPLASTQNLNVIFLLELGR